jgi:hypothetical protein
MRDSYYVEAAGTYHGDRRITSARINATSGMQAGDKLRARLLDAGQQVISVRVKGKDTIDTVGNIAADCRFDTALGQERR